MEEPKTLTAEQQVMAELASLDFKLDLWDESPSMWGLVEQAGGSLSAVPFRLSDSIWGLAPIHLVLASIAGATLAAGEAGIPSPITLSGGKIVGLILRTEGWGVRGRTNDEEGTDAPMIDDLEKLMAEGRQLSEHPDRFEVKTYQLVIADGQSTLSLKRGRGEEGEWADSVEGRVPDALRRVFEALIETSRS